ncbi:MAG: hypothetical protein NZZ41_07015 [Candidatus Dojkabacteria bacterium]|nr:hypothetical protein [Candidatus Dojkabacteria bacterium]
MSVVDRFFELVFTNYSGQVLTKLAGDKFEQDIERSGSENARCSPITLSTLVDISGEVPERSFVTVYLYDK